MMNEDASHDILLCTINAKYVHASLGLRYLRANLIELRPRSSILEFTISQSPSEIVESIIEKDPKIVGFGVYIWNLEITEKVVDQIKKLCPDILIILGGPELSHGDGTEDICQLADCTVSGEGDLAFRKICRDFFEGTRPPHFLQAPLLDLKDLALPYGEYSDEDLKSRLIYVEASRGCPYRCEFCLSSLDKGVRDFQTEQFLIAMEDLLKRGCSKFKFVDRTFNLKPSLARAIMNFFLERMREGLFLHFEMVPDRLPDTIRELLPDFPSGSLQFEIGIQTLNPNVGSRISRKVDPDTTFKNLSFLLEETQVHLHLDLIVGLPGENLESFARSFDQIWNAKPHEIQVGILKRLKGTPIDRHTDQHGMVYSTKPPYEILKTDQLDFMTLQKLKRFARIIEIFSNGGRFPRTLEKLVQAKKLTPFETLYSFSEWIWEKTARTHSISFGRQISLIKTFWREVLPEQAWEFEKILIEDLSDPHANPKLSKKGLPPHLVSLLSKRWKNLECTPETQPPGRPLKSLQNGSL